MGKRKERRLAAMTAVGRRFKLDLFAEPSGDLGGSSAKDEVGKDVNAKLDAELLNLPLSSGKQVENPLSLLGQYSDDDLDEGSNDTASKQDASLVADDNQIKVSVDIPSEAGEVGGNEELSAQKADSHKLETDSALGSVSLGDAGAVLSNKVISDEKCHEVDIENQDPVPEASDIQTTGGVSSCWKMVWHEESNRYYYWNTVTGETSWEVPDALTLGTGLPDEHRMLETSMEESAAGNINASNAAFGVKLDDFSTRDTTGYANGVSDVTAVSELRSEAIQSVEQSEGAASLLLNSSTTVAAFPYGTSTVGSYSLCGRLDTDVGSLSAGSQEVHGHSMMISPQVAIDLPSQLLRHGESMLERLKLLQGSGSDQQGKISKYMLEIEVRLFDIRSLLSHGSSLGPFWLHSERQLSQLEDAINTEIGEQNNRINGMHLSSTEGKEEKLEDREETIVNTDMKISSPESCANMHNADASAIVQKTSLYSASDGQIFNLQQISEQNHSTDLDDEEINGAASLGKASPKVEFQTGEDVDMDIDMEVEDPSPARIDMRGQLVTPEQIIQASIPMTEQSLGPDSELIIPPPLDQEWIPPPPPDNEGIPPPPPDEPPELCPPPPPSEPDPAQSIYNQQYNVTYGGCSVPYFDNTSTGALGGSLYELADGSQVTALNSAVYYTTALTMQPTVVPNPVESVVYYGHQNGVMPIVPVESIVSSGLQPASAQMNCGDLSSKQIATVDAVAEDPLLSQHFDSAVPGTNAGAASTEVSSTSVVSAPPIVSAKEYVSVPSFSAAAASATVTSSAVVSDVPAPLPKAQAKASKVKKSKVAVAAVSSLRSNKKVSSLVDKWKAAKEELQEEEEEQRETPLEILEKKRRREIEEWRAQQIASGEAKENANFQPLGGNWRERVKRRRAQKGATVEASSDVAANGAANTKQPDLNELSRDLPSGWQAYWDESSRQVYYANSITLETTWTKPTR